MTVRGARFRIASEGPRRGRRPRCARRAGRNLVEGKGKVRLNGLLLVLVLVGTATMYAGPARAPLYCDGWDTEWHYDVGTEPWVALDVGLFESGLVPCGAPVTVWGPGWSLRARALDAGRLAGHYVEEWGADRPIVVDVPEHLAPFEGMSAGGVIVIVGPGVGPGPRVVE